jgi:hypothetical protein
MEEIKKFKIIKVGGHKIKIIYPYNFEDKIHLGLCLWDEKEIRIGEYSEGNIVNIQTKKEALLHEILHTAADFSQTILENDIIGRLSETLFMIMRDNKKLFQFLIEEKK